MTFQEFLDIQYVEKNIDLQMSFSLKTQAESRACHDLIGAQRKYFKLIAYFKLTANYLLCRIKADFPQKRTNEELTEIMNASKERAKLQGSKENMVPQT